MRWMLLCAAVMLAACGETESTGEDCEASGGWARQTCVAHLHDDLHALTKKLQPPKAPNVAPPKCPAYDPDEVCDGECEAARGAAKEYERKFKAQCAMAMGMCHDMQDLGHWKEMNCADTCLFFGDGPAEKRKP